MRRRDFACGLAGLLALPARLRAARELRCDIAVIGGGVGGCAAALGALRNGMRVVLTEETDWIGGQLTSQAVPPDEHRWIEQSGCTRAYRTYRNSVRDYYRRNYPLTDAARQDPYLNPGNGWVSRLTHEPRVSVAVLEAMLTPYLADGSLTVLLRHKPAAAEVARDRVQSVRLQDLETGRQHSVSAPYFIDATETGELLPLTKTEYVTGAEAHAQTGEPHAAPEARPHSMQAFTVCFAMDYVPGEDHTIDKPAEYAFWRDYVPALTPPWTGRLLSDVCPDPITLQPRRFSFDPACEGGASGKCLWTYRRILDPHNFTDPAMRSVTLVNWPQNDYWLGNLYECPAAEARANLTRARELSLSLLYWLQTEAPRSDGGNGWRGLRPRGDAVGTADGLAKAPYVRESRRIAAEFTLLEQQVGNAFPDSVGVGSYRIDLHPTSGGENYIDIASRPFQLPLGALIPRRVENLLAGCKNLGATHVTNGCYRLHPVEWNIGEAAGCAAAEAVRLKTTPRAIRNTPRLLAAFQNKLRAQGFELAWK